MRAALVLSGAIHLMVALALLLMGRWFVQPPLTMFHDLELEVQHNPEGQKVEQGDDRGPRADLAPRPRIRPRAQGGDQGTASKRPPRTSVRQRRPAQKRTPPEVGRPFLKGERAAEAPHHLLQMRSRDAHSQEPSRQERPPKDRFASFYSPGAARRPEVVHSARYRGLKMAVYDDGGRLLSSTGAPRSRPGAGSVGLLSLSTRRLGGSSGRHACDPYRGRAHSQGRELVILIDTSSSVTSQGRAPAAVVCAAGAALSALSRGYPVAVGNFSSGLRFLHATRDEYAIYRALSILQRQGTRLPAAPMLGWGRKVPRDFVLITDTAIENLEQAAPRYALLLRRQRGTRALLFVLGDGLVCEQCVTPPTDEIPCFCLIASRSRLDLLRAVGFVPRFVERPGWKLRRSVRSLAVDADAASGN